MLAFQKSVSNSGSEMATTASDIVELVNQSGVSALTQAFGCTRREAEQLEVRASVLSC
jgi:hypothetical protein